MTCIWNIGEWTKCQGATGSATKHLLCIVSMKGHDGKFHVQIRRTRQPAPVVKVVFPGPDEPSPEAVIEGLMQAIQGNEEENWEVPNPPRKVPRKSTVNSLAESWFKQLMSIGNGSSEILLSCGHYFWVGGVLVLRGLDVVLRVVRYGMSCLGWNVESNLRCECAGIKGAFMFSFLSSSFLSFFSFFFFHFSFYVLPSLTMSTIWMKLFFLFFPELGLVNLKATCSCREALSISPHELK